MMQKQIKLNIKVKEWAQAHNCWVTKDYKPGDLLLFNFNGKNTPKHIHPMNLLLVVEQLGPSVEVERCEKHLEISEEKPVQRLADMDLLETGYQS